MLERLKIGMISFAHGHARSYFHQLKRIPEVQIAGIADENKERVEPFITPHHIPYYADYRELLEDQDIQAVIICSENVHHAKYALDAARAGKHVICEKPLGVSVAEMQQMIATCQEHGVQLMTTFPCRYIPAVIEAREAVQRGEIGDILAIKGTNRGRLPSGWFSDPTLSGGGAIIDHTVHVMDLINWFLEDEVSEVYARAGTLFNDITVEDAGMVHVKFANGAIAVIDTSWSRAKSFPTGGDVTMEIIGTRGVISVDALAEKNEVFSDERMASTWSYWGDSMDEYLVKDLVQALREGKPVPISGEDGLKSTQVALAAYESIRTGTPVQMHKFANPAL